MDLLGEWNVDGDASGILRIIKMPLLFVKNEGVFHYGIGEGWQCEMLIDVDRYIHRRIRWPKRESFLGDVAVAWIIPADRIRTTLIERRRRRGIDFCGLLRSEVL